MSNCETVVRRIVEKQLQDNWTLTKIAFDNVKFIPVRGVDFIRCIIEQSGKQKISSNCTRRDYTVLIEVKVAANSGTVTINSHCDLLKNLFDGFSSGHFNCLNGSIERVGKVKEWFQKNVILDCKYLDFT